MQPSDKPVKCKKVKVFAGSAQPQSLKWTVPHLSYCFMAKGRKLLVRYQCRKKKNVFRNLMVIRMNAKPPKKKTIQEVTVSAAKKLALMLC